MVIAGKLGKNGELSETVAEQLEHDVRHVRDEAPEAYARCYEKTHAQKRRLGLIAGPGMPDEIEIDGSEVEGLVVVCRYTQEAMAQAQRLRASHPEIRVHVFLNRLVGKGWALVGSCDTGARPAASRPQTPSCPSWRSHHDKRRRGFPRGRGQCNPARGTEAIDRHSESVTLRPMQTHERRATRLGRRSFLERQGAFGLPVLVLERLSTST